MAGWTVGVVQARMQCGPVWGEGWVGRLHCVGCWVCGYREVRSQILCSTAWLADEVVWLRRQGLGVWRFPPLPRAPPACPGPALRGSHAVTKPEPKPQPQPQPAPKPKPTLLRTPLPSLPLIFRQCILYRFSNHLCKPPPPTHTHPYPQTPPPTHTHTDKEGLQLVLPPPRWCTDNGVMTAWAGIERLARGWAEPPPPPLPLPSQREAAAVAAAAAAEAAAAYPASLASVGEEEVAGVSGSGAAAAAAATGGAAGGGEEWIELKPRWPLTSELHPRSAAAQADQRRSIKKVRMAVPLSDLEPPSPPPRLAAAAAAAGGGAAAAGAAR